MKKNISKYLLILFCLTTLAYTGCVNKTVGEAIDDTVIVTNIEAKLLADPITNGSEIDVSVFKGDVQLSGYVKSDIEKQRAGNIARTVDGVTSVKNSLIVEK